MGTSLQVFPFSDAATKHSSAVKVFINNEPVHNFHETDNNLFLQGECDDVVKDLVDACGWNVSSIYTDKLYTYRRNLNNCGNYMVIQLSYCNIYIYI